MRRFDFDDFAFAVLFLVSVALFVVSAVAFVLELATMLSGGAPSGAGSGAVVANNLVTQRLALGSAGLL